MQPQIHLIIRLDLFWSGSIDLRYFLRVAYDYFNCSFLSPLLYNWCDFLLIAYDYFNCSFFIPLLYNYFIRVWDYGYFDFCFFSPFLYNWWFFYLLYDWWFFYLLYAKYLFVNGGFLDNGWSWGKDRGPTKSFLN